MTKFLHFTGALLTMAAFAIEATALPVTYSIPTTQEEFEAQWEVVPGSDDKTWTYVAPQGSTPAYATTPGLKENTETSTTITGPTLIISEPITMKAGQQYTMQALVSSKDYNDDERFYIVAGTDKNNLQPINIDRSDFYRYLSRTESYPSFAVKPADSSSKRLYSVPEDGEYYIGIRGWYASGSFTDKTLATSGLLIERIPNAPGNISGGGAVAAKDGSYEVTLSWKNPTKNKDGKTDITEAFGINIYRGTSDSKGDLYTAENLIATINDCSAGQEMTFMDNAANSNRAIEAPGKYYYYLAPFNEDGENSDFASACRISVKWVGEDVKLLNPLNGSATPDGNNVIVRFQNRHSIGNNDGYINPSKCYNYITRSKNGAAAEVIAEHYVADADDDGYTTYIDTALDGPGSYKYTIYSGYGPGEDFETELSTKHEINPIFAGGAMTVPFSDDFSDADMFAIYSQDQSSSSYQWQHDKTYKYIYLKNYNSITTTIFTPYFELEAGKTYKIKASAWCDQKSYSYQADVEIPLELFCGPSANTGVCKKIADHTVKGSKNDKETVEGYFAPETSGIYYFGIKATTLSTPHNNKAIYLDDLVIEESEVLPASASDFKAEIGENGSHTVNISFTIPSTSNAGVALESLSRVVVNRYDGDENPETVVVWESDTPELGKKIEFTDEVPEAGYYYYGVTSILDDKASEERCSEKAWIGYDTPRKLSSVSYSLNEESTPVVSWNELASYYVRTLHDGYYDAENIKYNVYRTDALHTDNEPVLVGIVTTAEKDPETLKFNFTDSSIHQAEWSKYRYAVSIVNGPMEGETQTGYNTLAGGVTALPFQPDLTDDAYVDALEGRGYVAENGITWKLKYDNIGTDNFAFLPPIDVTENATGTHTATMTLSRADEQYEEVLELYLCKVSTTQPSAPENRVTMKAVIPGETDMTLIKTITVQAISDAPATETADFEIPAAGRYRLAARCASEYNKGLTLHTLSVEPKGSSVGVEEISVADIDDNADYYTLQGFKVKNPEAGLYIRIANGKAQKVIIRK